MPLVFTVIWSIFYFGQAVTDGYLFWVRSVQRTLRTTGHVFGVAGLPYPTAQLTWNFKSELLVLEVIVC
jgi:hypothetical protein